MNDLALFWKDEGRLEMHWSDRMVGHWAGIKGKEKGSIQGGKNEVDLEHNSPHRIVITGDDDLSHHVQQMRGREIVNEGARVLGRFFD